MSFAVDIERLNSLGNELHSLANAAAKLPRCTSKPGGGSRSPATENLVALVANSVDKALLNAVEERLEETGDTMKAIGVKFSGAEQDNEQRFVDTYNGATGRWAISDKEPL